VPDWHVPVLLLRHKLIFKKVNSENVKEPELLHSCHTVVGSLYGWLQAELLDKSRHDIILPVRVSSKIKESVFVYQRISSPPPPFIKPGATR
jgi:hypothetical protein